MTVFSNKTLGRRFVNKITGEIAKFEAFCEVPSVDLVLDNGKTINFGIGGRMDENWELFDEKMELKTLKDFFHNCGSHSQTVHTCSFCNKPFLNGPKPEAKFAVNLKQEAIKWVKELRGNPLGKEPTHYIINLQIANWITVFFNLTEEDLK